MTSQAFNTLITSIESRPTFKALTVLDRGSQTILVYTTEDKWFLRSNDTWTEIDSMTANERCHNSYFPNRWLEMQEA